MNTTPACLNRHILVIELFLDELYAPSSISHQGPITANF